MASQGEEMTEYCEVEDSCAHPSLLKRSQCLVSAFSASEFPVEPR